MRLVQAKRSPMDVLTLKHSGFEHSNGPIRPVAKIRPGTSNKPQMDAKLIPNGFEMDFKWSSNLSEWIIEWMNEWETDGMIEWVKWKNECMNEWMSACMNEWKVWVNEQMNEWTNYYEYYTYEYY